VVESQADRGPDFKRRNPLYLPLLLAGVNSLQTSPPLIRTDWVMDFSINGGRTDENGFG